MALKFTPKFTQSQIKAYIIKGVEQINKAIESRLIRVGERFISNARVNGSYQDVTGNLRSSIGYIVLKDGISISESFPGEQSEGTQTGKRLAHEVAANFTRGYVLIVVAGMDYAASVESRGKEVLTGSSLIAENELKAALQEIQRKVA